MYVYHYLSLDSNRTISHASVHLYTHVCSGTGDIPGTDSVFGQCAHICVRVCKHPGGLVVEMHIIKLWLLMTGGISYKV